ncbi:MAG: serine/threonine-protein kinase [Polyangiaceae bacterium]
MTRSTSWPRAVTAAPHPPQARRARTVPSSPGASGWQRAALAVPDAPLRPGYRVRGTSFHVQRCLGEGGMGEVYEVEHRRLGRRCALKLLHRRHAGRSGVAAQLYGEARLLASLRHPNLLDVFDLGNLPDGRPWFAMELLSGADLRHELSRLGVISVPTALDLAAQALDALAVAHDAGVVHGDVKVENLFLCDDASLRLLDSGAAARARAPARRAGQPVTGTPRTMAPEQHGGAAVDARTDVYAMGLVLYELVAGRGPFDDLRGDPLFLREAHLVRQARPPSELASQRVRASFDALVLRALEKDPAMRFDGAREMREAVLALRGERRRQRGAPPVPELTVTDAAHGRGPSTSATWLQPGAGDGSDLAPALASRAGAAFVGSAQGAAHGLAVVVEEAHATTEIDPASHPRPARRRRRLSPRGGAIGTAVVLVALALFAVAMFASARARTPPRSPAAAAELGQGQGRSTPRGTSTGAIQSSAHFTGPGVPRSDTSLPASATVWPLSTSSTRPAALWAMVAPRLPFTAAPAVPPVASVKRTSSVIVPSPSPGLSATAPA